MDALFLWCGEHSHSRATLPQEAALLRESPKDFLVAGEAGLSKTERSLRSPPSVLESPGQSLRKGKALRSYIQVMSQVRCYFNTKYPLMKAALAMPVTFEAHAADCAIVLGRVSPIMLCEEGSFPFLCPPF